MSRLIILFLQDFQAEIILVALRRLKISFFHKGLNTDSIDKLIKMVQEQIAVNKFLEDYE